MSRVLSLIAHPETVQMNEADFDGLAFRCLSPNRAYDVFDVPAEKITALKQTYETGVDFIEQDQETRRKKLLIADMDSTIVTSETLDDLADFAGIKAQVADITQRAMNGEIQFEDALRERVSMLKGLSESFLQKALDEVQIMPGAHELVATMKANGAFCALVSGGFTFFTQAIADRVGFHYNVGNRMEMVEGTLSGRVLDPIVTKDTKLEQLHHLCSEQKITLAEALSVGDGANDLPMLMAAGLGIAYHAKPSVAAAATHKVTYCDLRALLYAQGYTDDEIID